MNIANKQDNQSSLLIYSSGNVTKRENPTLRHPTGCVTCQSDTRYSVKTDK